jgi:hypothetical protein
VLRNGTPAPEAKGIVCGADLNPARFQEDCEMRKSGPLRYGHRNKDETPNDCYATSPGGSSDQAEGCHYEGNDAPHITYTGKSGDKIDLFFDFRGSLVDTRDGTELDVARWTVVGTDIVP